VTTFSARDLFAQLDGKEFTDHKKMKQSLLGLLEKYSSHFPAGFKYSELLQWGQENGWVIAAKDGTVMIRVNGSPETHRANGKQPDVE
jgi:hypothetical protein